MGIREALQDQQGCRGHGVSGGQQGVRGALEGLAGSVGLRGQQ